MFNTAIYGHAPLRWNMFVILLFKKIILVKKTLQCSETSRSSPHLSKPFYQQLQYVVYFLVCVSSNNEEGSFSGRVRISGAKLGRIKYTSTTIVDLKTTIVDYAKTGLSERLERRHEPLHIEYM